MLWRLTNRRIIIIFIIKSRDDGSSAVKQFFGGEYDEVEEELKELDEGHDDGEVWRRGRGRTRRTQWRSWWWSSDDVATTLRKNSKNSMKVMMMVRYDDDDVEEQLKELDEGHDCEAEPQTEHTARVWDELQQLK